MIISLLIGAAIGALRQQAGEDLSGQFGIFIRSQQAFEQALLSDEQGRPRFTDIAVHSRRAPDGKGGTKPAYLVSGSYFDGHYEQSGGKLIAKWQPAFFLADVPYKPVMDLSRLGRPDLAQKLEALPRPTVVDYLKSLNQLRRTPFTQAWWLGMGLGSWMLASFIVIGVIWPICVNLMVYGSWRQPPVEKGIDLSKVKPPAAAPQPVPADINLDQLRALEAELEAELANAPAPATAPAAPAKGPRVLTAAPVAPAPAVVEAASAKEFGAKKEDYYPTTLRVPGSP
jgi:hypothetical protein